MKLEEDESFICVRLLYLSIREYMEVRFPCEDIDRILLHRNSFFICALSRSDVPGG